MDHFARAKTGSPIPKLPPKEVSLWGPCLAAKTGLRGPLLATKWFPLNYKEHYNYDQLKLLKLTILILLLLIEYGDLFSDTIQYITTLQVDIYI